MRGLSACTLFVDLCKAFDYALREVVLGWLENSPKETSARIQHFVGLGLADGAAAALVEFITVNGHVLQHLGTSPDAAALAMSLHEATKPRGSSCLVIRS